MAEKESPSAVPSDPSPTAPQGHGGRGGESTALACQRCSFLNAPDQTWCEMCETALTRKNKRERNGDKDRGRQGKRAAVMDLTTSSDEEEKDEDMLANIPCPVCTYVGNALDASECVVCATSFFGGGATNHHDKSLGELRSMAAATASQNLGTSGTSAVKPLVAWSRKRLVAERKRLVAEQRAETSTDCTVGIIENLMAIAATPLPVNSRAKTTSTIRLCSPLTHYCQRKSDILSLWSCGYRNIQMLASSLQTRRMYREVLFGGTGIVPQVIFIQRWIEQAWALGFDREGAQQLGNSLAGNSTWIGACEAVALLRSFRIRATIVQAHPSTTSKSKSMVSQATKGGSEAGEAVLEFAQAYFSTPWQTLDVGALAKRVRETMAAHKIRKTMDGGGGASGGSGDDGGGGGVGVGGGVGGSGSGSGSCTDVGMSFASEAGGFRPPLFFQHAGHSRTIVGVEEKMPVAKCSSGRGGGQSGGGEWSQLNLLIFDPVTEGSMLNRSTRENKGWQGLLKRGAHTLRQEELQLAVILPGGLMTDTEWEASKVLDSVNLLPYMDVCGPKQRGMVNESR